MGRPTSINVLLGVALYTVLCCPGFCSIDIVIKSRYSSKSLPANFRITDSETLMLPQVVNVLHLQLSIKTLYYDCVVRFTEPGV